ncbi:MAG: hypothetical protein ACSHXF_06955 [Aquaticitalea sp.]
MLSTLRKIEDVHLHKGYVIKNLWKIVIFGVMISLAVPAQGLGDFELKGPSILKIMKADYWEAAFVIAILYTMCFIVFHIGWKWEDSQYLKELYEKKHRLIKELGITMEDEQSSSVS